MPPPSTKRKRSSGSDAAPAAASAPSAKKRSTSASSSSSSAAAGSRSRDSRKLKRDTEQHEIDELESRVRDFKQPKEYGRFEHLPLSGRTARGLKKAAYTEMTPIQAKSLPLSLAGKDVLGAARTGSGKTLAFLIPVLERLYRSKWGPHDGLGALVISPTRELAIQIFEVLRKLGVHHTYSAGLVIGGKDLKQEKDRLARMNILVATPGRLLQHMDQTVGFDCSNLQVLVLDEADRILDMGFANTLNAIVENLPKHRQTLLFSATQTKRVKDLARLSLQDPEYVAVREAQSGEDGGAQGGDGAATGGNNNLTPRNLEQHYMVVPLEQKLDLLFSFLRTHTKNKLLVFFSSCRQVQFAHEAFCKLRPGLSLLALHGKQKQAKRLQIFTEFTRTQHAALFATDIAARGLDFPAVDWVLQVDAPEDVDTYVHRVGRTARYNARGKSLTMLLPSEEKGMLERLAEKGITGVGRLKPRESKTQSIQNQLQAFLFQSPELKYTAQKAFVSYVRSVHLQRDKKVFDVLDLPLEKYAAALGLPGAPKVKFVREASAARKKAEYKARAAEAKAEANAGGKAGTEGGGDKGEQADSDDDDDDDAAPLDANGKPVVRTKYDRMFARQNQGVLSEHYARLIAQDGGDSGGESEGEGEDGMGLEESLLGGGHAGDDDDDDDGDAGDFLQLKRADHGLDSGSDSDADPDAAAHQRGGAATAGDADADATTTSSTHLSKRKLAQGASKKALAAAGLRGAGTKLTFDDEGVPHALYEMQDEEAFRAGGSAAEQARRFVLEEGERLRARDVEDKERVREKRRERRRKEKEREREGGGEGGGEGEGEGASEDDDDDDDDDEGYGGAGAVLAPEDTRSDGYETPDFDLPSGDDGEDSEGEAEIPAARAGYARSDSDSDSDAASDAASDGPPEAEAAVKGKKSKGRSKGKGKGRKNEGKRSGKRASEGAGPAALEDEEALALRILAGGAGA